MGAILTAAVALWVWTAWRDRTGYYRGAAYPQTGLPKVEVRIGELPLTVEVADERDEIMIGMMGRRHVPDGAGMLFVFDRPARHAFWMKNCPVDLDLAVFNADGDLVKLQTMAAWDTTRGRYGSETPIRYAIETRGGYLREHGVAVGDKLHLPPSLASSN